MPKKFTRLFPRRLGPNRLCKLFLASRPKSKFTRLGAMPHPHRRPHGPFQLSSHIPFATPPSRPFYEGGQAAVFDSPPAKHRKHKARRHGTKWARIFNQTLFRSRPTNNRGGTGTTICHDMAVVGRLANDRGIQGLSCLRRLLRSAGRPMRGGMLRPRLSIESFGRPASDRGAQGQ